MKGELKYNEPLAPHTSWHIGGPADRYYRPIDQADLSEFLAQLSVDEPLTWLGLGSNVLISDEGIRGTVIHLQGSVGSVDIQDTLVKADASVPCAKVAKLCAKEGLTGAEFFAGIPGTIGGALCMNAGAFGGETWPTVVKVEVIDRHGEKKIRTPKDYQIAYRSVQGPKDEWFLSGYFQFQKGNVSDASTRIKQLLRQRNETQPIGVFSCGSVFQNPPGDYAARLIEASHLKGYRVGGAEISPKHANFIINLGNAKATDVLQIIRHIQAVVLKEHKVQLKTEVRILGEILI